MKILQASLYTVAVLLCIFLGFSLVNAPPRGERATAPFYILQGESVRSVAIELEREGYIRSAFFFVSLVRVSGTARSIKAGEYALRKDMRATSILRVLARGVISMERFTVPEGLHLRQVAELLENLGIVPSEEFLEACSDRRLLEK